MPRSRQNLVVLLIAFAAGAAMFILWRLQRAPYPWERPESSVAPSPTVTSNAAWLKAREEQADQTVWAKEMLAQKCGRVFESLWDSVNASTNKLETVAKWNPAEVVLGDWTTPQLLPHGIEIHDSRSASGGRLSPAQWSEWISQFGSAGWQLDNIEFRHNRFDVDARGQPAQSRFYFAARLTNPATPNRAIIEGDLIVNWAAMATNDVPAIKQIDASRLQIRSRAGEPPFKLILKEDITPKGRAVYSDPLILYDLDGDGLSEIILAGANLVYHRQPDGQYEKKNLCCYPAEAITSAVIADFDGDGAADFLCANRSGLLLFKGSPEGTFDEPGRLVWKADPPLKNAMVLTCADIDGDGRLDVFFGQYKMPDLGQVLKPYYYDANDSFPWYLLRNDGHGNFSDITESAGLGPKRWRRVYSASFADLDGDGHPDLVVVSDFAGLDLYRNDGHGHFNDVTGRWVGESHGFGMAHALADFNGDGRLDLLMIGMPSPTVDRLEHLGLSRGYSDDDAQRRPAMTFGNRLYLARENGGFEQTSLNNSIARSGWSWGCSAFDFDNDGFADVYIANGLESKRSVRDYESEFWLHNLYVDEKIDDVTATGYLMDRFGRTRGSGWSYGGYEKNRLYLNQKGKSFIEIGQLAGVALEQDSRNVVADDLDGDGRMDLLVTTAEVWPEKKQTLYAYRNTLPDGGHWIGFRFREEEGGISPVGVRVKIGYAGRHTIKQILTGDSFRSQQANTLHFGLGQATNLDNAEIRWLNGRITNLLGPEVDRYYLLGPSSK